MEAKMSKEKLKLIREIRQMTLFYSISYLSHQYTINLEMIKRLAEEGINY
jgi:hypothetical protein